MSEVSVSEVSVSEVSVSVSEVSVSVSVSAVSPPVSVSVSSVSVGAGTEMRSENAPVSSETVRPRRTPEPASYTSTEAYAISAPWWESRPLTGTPTSSRTTPRSSGSSMFTVVMALSPLCAGVSVMVSGTSVTGKSKPPSGPVLA